MATPLTTDDRKQYQYDILWNTMSDNELLPYSSVSSLTKQLNTTNKSVIKAINELLTKLQTNDTTVGNFSNVFNTNVGNPELDTQDWANLHQIDTNVIKAIYKLYLQIDNALKIQGKNVPMPTSTDDGKALVYDAATNSFKYVVLGSGGGGTGDMLKSTYDTDGDGKVNSAVTADSVAWTGISGKPVDYPPSAHNHDTSYLKLSGGTLTGPTLLKDGANIVPENANMVDLGSVDKPFKDVYVGPATLYVNGNPVLQSTGTTTNISTSVDEHLSISTSGLGTTRLASAKEVFLYSSQIMTIQSVDSITATTNADYSVTSKGRISFTSDVGGQNVVLETKATDGSAHINLRSTGQINLTSTSISASSKPMIAGYAALTEVDATRFAASNHTHDTVYSKLGHTHASTDVSGLGTAATKDTGIASGNIPVLDVNGKIDNAVLPTLVTSINSKTGAVTLTAADVGAATTAAVTTSANGLMISTDKSKLDGIYAGATKVAYVSNGTISINGTNQTIYTHPTGDGNSHVPANGTTRNGQFLQATATAGTYQWAALPTASTTVSGIAMLYDGTDSTLATKAATANAVKMANDNANTRALSTHNHDTVYVKQDGTTRIAGSQKVQGVQVTDSAGLGKFEFVYNATTNTLDLNYIGA